MYFNTFLTKFSSWYLALTALWQFTSSTSLHVDFPRVNDHGASLAKYYSPQVLLAAYILYVATGDITINTVRLARSSVALWSRYRECYLRQICGDDKINTLTRKVRGSSVNTTPPQNLLSMTRPSIALLWHRDRRQTFLPIYHIHSWFRYTHYTYTLTDLRCGWKDTSENQ